MTFSKSEAENKKTVIITESPPFSLVMYSLHSILNAVNSSQEISTCLQSEAAMSILYSYPNDKDSIKFYSTVKQLISPENLIAFNHCKSFKFNTLQRRRNLMKRRSHKSSQNFY
jgi:hypothetical protein